MHRRTSSWDAAVGLICGAILILGSPVNGESKNLLKNPSFENKMSGEWICSSSKCSFEKVSSHSHTGAYSVRVYDRDGSKRGLDQWVKQGIKPLTNYYLSGYIQLDNQPWNRHRLEMYVQLKGGTPVRYRRFNIGRVSWVRKCDGWVHIGGDFTTEADTTEVMVTVLVGETDSVNYFLDTMSLVEIPKDPDWKEKANQRIDQLRRAPVNINIQVKRPYRPSNIVLWVNQTARSFPIGASISASSMYRTYTKERKYQDYFYNNFNWATFSNSVKWRFFESKEDQPYFVTVDRALEALAERNFTNVRGHCVVWGKPDKIVSWVKSKDPQGIEKSVTKRVNYLADHYGSKFSQWDVNNENLHGHWYEDTIGDYRFTQHLFEEMYKADSVPQLFLNDFYVLSGGLLTSAYVRMASSFVQQGVPVFAMGIQSHVSTLPADIDLYKNRLDRLATAGVPIWITEFDVRHENITYRAQVTEDLLRLYFSHPAVAGIILWTFWSGAAQFSNTALVDGDDFVENAVGQRFRELIHEEWRTNEFILLDDLLSQVKVMRAFYGTHDLHILDQGSSIGKFTFDLEKHMTTNIDVVLDKNGVHFNSA